MSLLLAGAKRIEHAAGARAGLHAYRALAERAPSADSALAHLAALRCAAECGDAAAFHKLLNTWPKQPGLHAERVSALAHRLAREGQANLARILLEAERARWSDAERRSPAAGVALYLAAALAPGEGRAELLRRLLATTNDAALADRATLRLAELARAKGHTAGAADSVRERAYADPGERVRRAELLLLSGSRFQRAAGFGELADLVALEPDAALAAAVRGLVHRLPALTALEEDRIRAVFTRLPDEPTRDLWLAFVDACLRRARDPRDPVAAGGSSPSGAVDLQWLHVTLHDLALRLRDAAPAERGPLERRLADLIGAGAAPAAGFLPYAVLVESPALRHDLVLRAEAAGEPGGRAALLALVHAEADALVASKQLVRAFRLTEAAVVAQRSGDWAEVRAAIASPR